MGLFRRKMVAALGEDTAVQGYDGVIELTRRLNSKFPTPRGTQVATVGILRSLMPSWLPGLFAVLFARPLPIFSAKMNAWVTALTCEWLMGDLAVNDVELDDGGVIKGAGVRVERCRYLEAAGCASVCINSCKVPTQEFFSTHMGLDLSMTPNYDDFSCQFDFGKAPLEQAVDEAFSVPCFSQCPSKQQRRSAGTCSKIRAMEERFPFQGIFVASISVENAIVFVTGGDGCGHANDVFSGCFADDAEEALRRAADAAAGVSMPVRLATNIVRFMHDNTGNWDGPAGGGVVSASFINAKPAVGGIGVEPRGGGVLRVLFTVASGAVADTVVRWRWKLRQAQVAVFDVLSDREEARHRALWPAFLAAKAAGKRAQFHRARLVVDGERVAAPVC
ncbi:hypothetical protein FOA52_008563 [Chlamydomonas sp. UWO 241]|nr:hypothetical protein FOA52_008563 [Chlamydomonas sp. UWO 241]